MNPYNPILRKLLRLQVVPRWVIVPTIRKQTTAEHSHGVAAICLWLMNEGNNPMVSRASVLEYAIRHDEKESQTGDIPSPAKKQGWVTDNTPKLAFPQNTVDLVKLADFIEALIFMKHEMAMGNSPASTVFDYVWGGADLFYQNTDWFSAYFGQPDFYSLWRKISIETDINLHPGMRDE